MTDKKKKAAKRKRDKRKIRKAMKEALSHPQNVRVLKELAKV